MKVHFRVSASGIALLGLALAACDVRTADSPGPIPVAVFPAGDLGVSAVAFHPDGRVIGKGYEQQRPRQSEASP